MKKIYLSLIVACAALMVACGNSAVDKINQCVVDATEQTQEAKSAEEVAAIATKLQTQMNEITAEEGDKFTLGNDADESLAKYQEVVAAKLAEFGVEINF